MARLGINIDHVATLRQQRKTTYPDPVSAAAMAEFNGADNITCHLREDRRHVQDRDVRLLRETVQTELNFEMAATQEMVRFALDIKPNVVTLVPERREELTTEGGLDLSLLGDSFTRSIALLREAGIIVSLFIDPEPGSVKLAHRMGAQAVEIHTGKYANTVRADDKGRELERIREAVNFSQKLRLTVHAGHGLHYHNIQEVAAIPGIESFQIGHGVVAQALYIGLGPAVREMKNLIEKCSS